MTKYSLKISRQWAAERKQWGQPIGKHDPVAQKLAFVAGTAFGLEAVVDVSSRLADDKRNDIRIEAALAKLYASELGWRAIDTMIQIRGGRGYETAESLQARGEKPVPAEQLLRDMRINRIFEGSTEIMHLLIAREAVDQHLQAAGERARPADGGRRQVRDAVKAGGFYASWFPKLAVGEGQKPGAFAEFGPLAEHVRYVERGSRKLARSTFYLMGRYQARLEHKGHLLGRIVDIGAELYAIACACVYAQTHRPRGRRPPRQRLRAGRPVRAAGPPPRRRAVRRAVGQRRRVAVPHRPAGARRAATRGSTRTSSTPRARARCCPRSPRPRGRRRRPPPSRSRPRPKPAQHPTDSPIHGATGG